MGDSERKRIEDHCCTPFDTVAKGYCRALLAELARVEAERDTEREAIHRLLPPWTAETRAKADAERDAAIAQVKRLREALERIAEMECGEGLLCGEGEHDPGCGVFVAAAALAATEAKP